ncbi:CRP/FNR family transcriptional regulator, anaerobic regulatory protein [Paucidesulfovibrio gracilis DSM 16080]|uniref:CRP/FNR family transcriptional regulator, anaerobic regulatory protein n=1 Tax=Paucidesulfovibrio gracilis DSM 16080 TaxID=1121449 RepID=A0A1T4WYH7_9BACT|nr:Crp/Fnr family transcriptional regulator [Paucidesulfovibrio gracilis]SKA81918.1 CRP/FNR family transcriptional regulator, anaerobic regulatory protein [Paucidesulfovibrio gracilis DSM 16080]
MPHNEPLTSLGIFQGLPENRRRELVAKGQVRHVAAGERIAERGQEVDAFFAVLEGQIKLSRSSLEGKEQTIYVFGPGEPFCLCGVFDTGAFLADAVALSQGRILILQRKAFDEAAEAHPVLLRNMVRLLSGRLRAALELVESLALREIPQRVAAYLRHLPVENDEVRLGMTHRELAKIVGATPETLSRALRRLDREGMIRVTEGRIRILDAEALARRADQG